MESESLHEPTALAVLELNVEEKPAAVVELRFWARQFVEASLDRRELWNPAVYVLHAMVVNLAGQIISKLPAEVVWLKEHPM